MSDSTDAGQSGETGAQSVAISIVRGDPSAEEIAAVTAVVSGALEELADATARDAMVTTTAWQRSQRNIREPINPGPGAWRSFG